MTAKDLAENRRSWMRRTATTIFLLVLVALLWPYHLQAAPSKVEYLEAKPLSKVVAPRLKPVETSSKLDYVLTWGGT
jgi:hypothetical protein